MSAQNTPTYVPVDGLIAWYPMNGNADDLGSEDANGELFGPNPVSGRHGVPGTALEFDGFDDYIQVASNSEVFDFYGRDELTISSWIKLYSTGTNQYGIASFSPFGDSTPQYAFKVETVGALYFISGQSLFESNGLNIGGTVLTTEDWLNVAMTYDGDSLNFYVNGQVDMAKQISDAFPQSNVEGSSLFIGKAWGSANTSLNGALDDVGIWNRALSEDEILSLYNAPPPNPGCTDITACNFNPEATLDDETCYSCDLPASHCGEGTVWDSETQECIVAIPTDTNFDGCTDLNDLMDILANYGDCAVIESEFTCGDPLEYQGYDYETVLIGEQCWFAENLRAEDYRDGDDILNAITDNDWQGAANQGTGAYAAYQNDQILAAQWGYLYNGYAVNDDRGICPANWKAPDNPDWVELAVELGGLSVAGLAMKAGPEDILPWNGTNSSGFIGLPTGDRHNNGSFNHANEDEEQYGIYWSATLEQNPGYYRLLDSQNTNLQIAGGVSEFDYGAAVRCIKD